jgi:hypothetical protein
MASTIKLIADHADAWDWAHDPYGTAVGLAFDICEVLNAADVEGDITPEPFARWQYSPSPYVAVPSLDTLADEEDGDSYGVRALAESLRDGEITTDQLIKAGDVLDRYIDLCILAGRDY